jgi:23S rRNA (guanosine2251-2'-O)-methyltransferase
MMEDNDFNELIMGLHSIEEALNNTKRFHYKLYATSGAFNEIKRKIKGDRLKRLGDFHEIVSPHALQEKAKKYCEKLGLNFVRVPSQAFILTHSLEDLTTETICRFIKRNDEVKIICLDQVTDVHNAAAILRTAAFYGVNFIVTAGKGSFGKGPSFSRIASGAIEHVPMVKCGSLSRFLKKLMSLDVNCVGLSEHAENSFEGEKNQNLMNQKICLVFGAEDKGLSHAVSRVLSKKIVLKPKGLIKSLNVSVATAVTMEKIFG